MKKIMFLMFISLCSHNTHALTSEFAYLYNTAPSIQQSMRYASNNNFTGHRVPGYLSPTCILTKQAAIQLAKVQKAAEKLGYSLKVYDCYRPQKAVNAFYSWSKRRDNKQQKQYWYPRVPKGQLFKRGYIALYSGHSRGSTVDLTLVKNTKRAVNKHPSKKCYGTTNAYSNDNSINMGTRFDCLDKSAHYSYAQLSSVQRRNRYILKRLMKKYGFRPYRKEWWHFTLNHEPFPKTYFNFTVR